MTATERTELETKRADLSKKAQDLHKKAGDEKRSMTAEEETQFDRMFAEVDEIRAKLEKADGEAKRNQRIADELRWAEQRQGRKTDPGGGGTENIPGNGGTRAAWNATDEYRSAFNSFLKGGLKTCGSDELRALSAGQDVMGGFLTAPVQMVNELIKRKDDLVFMRKLATKHSVTGGASSLGAPSLDADPSDPTWTSEIQTGSEDSSMRFGRRELHPYPLAKRIKVSRELIARAALGAEAIVRERIAYRQAITEENAFLNGTGANHPLGVFTASALGISTARDVSTDNTNTAITGDGLINAKYSLKAQYMNSPSLRWLFHRTAVRNIRKLKDSQNQYIWAAGLGGTPDTILEIPYIMSEYVPSTFTTGLYVGILGDFSYYWIADTMSYTIQRLDELYAEQNQIGFISRSQTDGMPILEEAFARVTLA